MKAAIRNVLIAGVLSTVPSHAGSLLERIIIVGDSVETGMNIRHAYDQASYRLQKRSNVIVHNFSSPGARMTSQGFLAGMTEAGSAIRLMVGYFKTSLYGLVVHIGVNDWGSAIPLADFGSAYGAFLDELPHVVRVVCVTPTWTSREGEPNRNGDTIADFRAAIQRVCGAHGAVVLDGLAAVPNDPSYFDDGLHPNDRGHRALGDFFWRQLRALGWL